LKRQIQILSILLLFPILNFGQDLKLDYDSKLIRKEIRKIVKKIAKTNEIHAEAVGFSGEKTSQYRLFEKLVKHAKDEELVELMNHPKAVVRGYVFWALAKRHYEALEEIYVKHVNDGEFVFQIQGCMGADMPVIVFMKWVVTPQMIDLDCKKIKKEAINRMEAKQYIFDEIKN